METSEGFCVHKDYGVICFVSSGRAMKVLSDGRVVIFNPNDKMKLRPVVSPDGAGVGLKKMKDGIEGKTKNIFEWKNIAVGSEFSLMCKVVGEMTRAKSSLFDSEKKLLQNLKKHIDLELSIVYNEKVRTL
jgi:hypothetical protein